MGLCDNSDTHLIYHCDIIIISNTARHQCLRSYKRDILALYRVGGCYIFVVTESVCNMQVCDPRKFRINSQVDRAMSVCRYSFLFMLLSVHISVCSSVHRSVWYVNLPVCVFFLSSVIPSCLSAGLFVCPSDRLSVCQTVCLSFIHLPVCSSVLPVCLSVLCLSVCTSGKPSACLSIRSFDRLFVRLPACQSVSLSLMLLSVCLFLLPSCLLVGPSVCLSFLLSVCVSVLCLFVYLS